MKALCMQWAGILPVLTLILTLAGCGDSSPPDAAIEPPAATASSAPEAAAAEALAAPAPAEVSRPAELVMPADIVAANPSANAERKAYFGDLHVHTQYSFDAFAFGTVATPYDAYRYAQGEAIEHPAGFEVKLSAPLDFYAVTDHAMFLGAARAAADTTTAFSKLPHVQEMHNFNAPENRNVEGLVQRVRTFRTFIPGTREGIADGSIDVEMVNDIVRSAWADIIAAAEAHNQPGSFTTFVAYEYTSSTDERGNLHRNVIFKDVDKLPAMPFSRYHSQNPEGLWDWMDALRAQGIETMSIPHNSNGSNGAMFKMVDWAGTPIDDNYAKQRIRNEPVVELTQIKGTSETHPALSSDDEWADFEIMPYRVGTSTPSAPNGSYAREALLNGLTLQDRGVANAYQFGFVAASDNHTAAAPLDEEDYFGKVGILDGRGDLRGSLPLTPDVAEIVDAAGRLRVDDIDGRLFASGSYETWGASGLTGVWAEANTREAIYNAFRRKETFATSGPRMKVRFFGGYGFAEAMLDQPDMLRTAYDKGVSMGSELLAQGDNAPTFIASAMRDPRSAALQRLQMIKGWTVAGEHFERVYDIACSDGGEVDPTTHRCPDNGAMVDLSDCSITPGVGANELTAVWRDPDFEPSQRAFYYVRALENPTCRWSTWDAVRAKIEPRPDLNATLQERVWSSPIWLLPNA